MRVAMIAMYGSGGVVDYSSQLASALGERVDLGVFAPDTREVRSAFDAGHLRAYGRNASKGEKLYSILSGIRDFDPDVIHLPFYGPRYDVLIAPVLALMRIPLVGTLHDPAPHSGLARRIFGIDVDTAGRRLSANFLDAVIVHGEYCANLAVDLGYDPRKLATIPHGIYDQFDESDAPTEENTILIFGYIRPNKGHDRIPALLDALEERVPDVTAIVAGAPDWEGVVDEAALETTLEELRSDDRVELHDRYVDDDEVPELFARAQVVVLPYRDTTMSGVAMIAYGLEKPIVATDAGDLGNLVREDGSGLLADRNSDDELARQVARLLTSESLRRERRHNIRATKGNYTWDTIAERTLAVYEGVLDDYSSRRRDLRRAK